MEILELDFQFWRFWAFSLLAIVISLSVVYFTMQFQGNTWANLVGYVTIGFTIIWFVCLIMFYKTYYEYRDSLRLNNESNIYSIRREQLLVFLSIIFAIIVIILVPYMDVSSNSKGQFAINFYSSFFGILISFFLGFSSQALFNRSQEIRQTKSEIKKSVNEAIIILKALRDEITHNVQLLNQIIDNLSIPNYVIFYNLQLSTWNSISITKLETLKNYSIIREISRIYYEYEHLNRKVNVQFEMSFSTLRALSNFIDIRNSLVNPIIEHAKILVVDSGKLLEEINKELLKYQQN